MKFGDPRLNLYRDIPPEGVLRRQHCAKFGDSRLKPSASFSAVDNFRLEADSDVISDVVVDPTGVKICVKFGDSR